MNRRILCIIALLLTAALLLHRPSAPAADQLPGAPAAQRTLISIWTLNSIGGSQAWLKQALKRYERTHPGVMTYLRQAAAEDLADPDAILSDLLLYMPGDLTDTAQLRPLGGSLPVSSALLSCGQKDGLQYGLPLCWGAYVMVIDSCLEPGSAATPAPTTLLGKPAPTPEAALASPTPGYPLEAAKAQAEPLQCAQGTALITLRMLLPGALPALPSQPITQQQVYTRYLAGQCASAVLTTGQVTALAGAVSSGKARPYRLLLPQSIVTDQVWLASLTGKASGAAADLLAWLISAEAQQLLTDQQLQPAREGTRLYAADWPAHIANAALHAFTAVNAYLPRSQSQQISWQVLQGQLNLAEAAAMLQ